MHDIPPYQQLFEASPHPYLILRADVGFTIVAVNNRYLEVTGTQREAIVGDSLFDIFPNNPNDYASDSVNDLRTSLNYVLKEKRQDIMNVQKYDIPLRDGSGNFELKYWSPINTPVFDTGGNVTYIIHHVEDVTEFIVGHERAINEQLRASEMRFQIIFERAATGIAIVSPEGRWLRVNHKLCQIVGYRRDELMGLAFQDITHPDDLDTDLNYVQRVLAGEITTFSMEKRYIRKNSSVIWINLTVSLVRKLDNTPDYFITIVEDIQARKEIEANLKEAKRIANLGHWKWDVNTNKYTWS
ncbi:MAG: PAS domain S-box protein, partial [Nitrosomonas sp.]